MYLAKFLLIILSIFIAVPDTQKSYQTPPDQLNSGVLLDDFESYKTGLPISWQFIDSSGNLQPVTSDIMSEEEYFEIQKENGNRFLRAVTYDRAHRLILMNKQRFDWNLTRHPRLAWRWRALKLPAGAREDVDDKNDSGAAVYVTFSRDWLGRPKSIKYVYSSTLPVGTVVSFGRLKVLVISSGIDGTGDWQQVDRDVVQDYRALFGGDPPDEPISIMLWSDSNSTHSVSVADFDDIEILPPFQR